MLRKLSKISAWFLYLSIVVLYSFSSWKLFGYRTEASLSTLENVLPILTHSFLQAGLSAIISLILGILLARSFFYLDFKGKFFLYKLISFIWSLPSLVIIFAVINVWGNSGWFLSILRYLGLSAEFNLYGLHGIIIAHCILNIPLVMKYCFEALRFIPNYQHRLAAQLELKGWSYFYIAEFPMLKTILPYLFMTVFLVCFTSFPIVLMLGGSPKYSTLEVAIYQAVIFEFDFAKAVMLISIQFIIGICLQWVMNLVSDSALKQFKQVPSSELWKMKPVGIYKMILQAVLFLFSFAILLPLVSVVWAGITVSKLVERLYNPDLWQATYFSLIISLIASGSVLIISYVISLEARQLLYKKQRVPYSILAGVTQYPLLLPVFLLAVGLFLIFFEVELVTLHLLVIVGICNGLVLLPFVYPMVFSVTWNSLTSQDKLAQSLGLTGFNRWWIVEKHFLIRPLINAFALAMSASLGSFAVIAFFGTPDFSSLPYLLYQQLGSYRTEDAAVTALILLVTALLPLLCVKDHK